MDRSLSAMASARCALAAFRRGSTHALDAADELLNGDLSPSASAFRLTFRATLWLEGLSDGPLPLVEEAQGMLEATSTASDGVAELCRVMSRASLLAFDLESMSRWHEVHSSLVSISAEHYEWYAATALWLDLMQGRPTVAREAEQRLAQLPADMPCELQVEFLILAALGTLLLKAPERAQPWIDRACALAKSEGLSEWRHLAALGRCRILRYQSKPHLAGLLLSRLSEHAPPAYRPWIAWESALATGNVSLDAAPDTAPDSARRGLSPAQPRSWLAVQQLCDLLDAGKCTPERVHLARAALSATLNGVRPMLYEVQLLAGALDYAQSPPKELRSWCWGQEPLLPAGLHGIACDSVLSPKPSSAVILRRGHVGRRVLSGALPAAVADLESDWVQKSGPRLAQTALAALALADHAELTHAELFRQTVGFEYICRLHQRLLHNVLERVSALLDGDGTLALGKQRVSLTLNVRALVVLDPRTLEPVGEQVLAALVHYGAGSPEQFSERLNIPARLIRRALQQLVADGAATLEAGRTPEFYKLSAELVPAAPPSLARPRRLSSVPPSRQTGT